MLFSEPKIPQFVHEVRYVEYGALFQCSSASRKFLNRAVGHFVQRLGKVSVLFSEPKIPQLSCACRIRSISNVSVLFSEPKIPQLTYNKPHPPRLRFVSVLFSEPKIPQPYATADAIIDAYRVSVLFSEPKIPQQAQLRPTAVSFDRFSALQRAENSSTPDALDRLPLQRGFSALQRAENSSTMSSSN